MNRPWKDVKMPSKNRIFMSHIPSARSTCTRCILRMAITADKLWSLIIICCTSAHFVPPWESSDIPNIRYSKYSDIPKYPCGINYLQIALRQHFTFQTEILQNSRAGCSRNRLVFGTRIMHRNQSWRVSVNSKTQRELPALEGFVLSLSLEENPLHRGTVAQIWSHQAALNLGKFCPSHLEVKHEESQAVKTGRIWDG